MNMEEEFGSQPQEASQSEDRFETPKSQDDNFLGLDQAVKLNNRTKVAKIDNERIFSSQRGIGHIACNYHKVIKIIKKNDKHLDKRLRNSGLSHESMRNMKRENELNNLSLILQFYQLWCHRLFPKARFKDCIQMLRGFSNRAGQLKLYRRDLIENEIQKEKVKRGMIPEEQDIYSNSIFLSENIEGTRSKMARSADENEKQNFSDEDWDFMNKNTTQGLFVEEDGDNPNELFINKDPSSLHSENDNSLKQEQVESSNDEKERRQKQNSSEEQSEEDIFSDNEDDIYDEIVRKSDPTSLV